jgi:hypothetical protein
LTVVVAVDYGKWGCWVATKERVKEVQSRRRHMLGWNTKTIKQKMEMTADVARSETVPQAHHLAV